MCKTVIKIIIVMAYELHYVVYAPAYLQAYCTSLPRHLKEVEQCRSKHVILA